MCVRTHARTRTRARARVGSQLSGPNGAPARIYRTSVRRTSVRPARTSVRVRPAIRTMSPVSQCPHNVHAEKNHRICRIFATSHIVANLRSHPQPVSQAQNTRSLRHFPSCLEIRGFSLKYLDIRGFGWLDPFGPRDTLSLCDSEVSPRTDHPDRDACV